jgi:hypothetical protein
LDVYRSFSLLLLGLAPSTTPVCKAVNLDITAGLIGSLLPNTGSSLPLVHYICHHSAIGLALRERELIHDILHGESIGSVEIDPPQDIRCTELDVVAVPSGINELLTVRTLPTRPLVGLVST